LIMYELNLEEYNYIMHIIYLRLIRELIKVGEMR